MESQYLQHQAGSLNGIDAPPPTEDKNLRRDVEQKGTMGSSRRNSIQQGQSKLTRLGWGRLTICLIVESVALGALSMPSVFARLGMIAGVLMSVGLGLIAIYTGYIVGLVALKYPEVRHYADAVRLIFGRVGYEVTSVMFVLLLGLTAGSHTLTGTIAFIRIFDQKDLCALVWGVISAVGYIDFASIISAIFITMVATGVQSAKAEDGLSAVPWSLWPDEDLTFASAFVLCTNIIFAYSFAVTQFSFMSEMHAPEDYMKSIGLLGLLEITIYTLTGAVIYAFVGVDVASPALLSAGKTISRVAFGIALPVIFISGSINTTVVGRYILDRAFKNSEVRYVNTRRGWLIWTGLFAIITIIAWVIAESIPFFNDLLGIMASLFVSGFSYYFPVFFWFILIKDGKWYDGWKNICLSFLNAVILCVGLMLFVCGTYANIQDIIDNYEAHAIGGSFACDANQYV
ncbi:hypothetical protein FDECE_4893 [Fusarium decemcellulare]|nr:hypothetical protein FDECE_4893 [Fusarium decemcellulare]